MVGDRVGTVGYRSSRGNYDGSVRVWSVVALLCVVACGTEPEVLGSATDNGRSPEQVTVPDQTPVPVTTTSSMSSPSSTSSTLDTLRTTTSMPSSWPLALDVLAVMVVAPEYSTGYQRDFFPHWTTIDGCSTRDRVLIAESTSFAQVDPFGCRVVAGDWVSPFDGAMWEDPAEIHIDHLVALKEAWESGAWAWTEADRRAFANDIEDPRPLNAVTGSVNQAKSDLDPSDWLPPLASARCRYVADWIAVKARWQLSMDGAEMSFLRSYLPANCADLRIAPWETVPVARVEAPTDTTTGDEIYFANCTEARAAGVAPIQVGEPGYRSGLDRDKDGVACE